MLNQMEIEALAYPGLAQATVIGEAREPRAYTSDFHHFGGICSDREKASMSFNGLVRQAYNRPPH